MKIGLYGMPTAGKTHILDRIDFLDVVEGSKMLRKIWPDFDSRDETGKNLARKELADMLKDKESFIMDGHYAFGDEIAFTESDGELYDIILYLYVSPNVIVKRMQASEKNRKYLNYDIKNWQKTEMEQLRAYCHSHKKDFYILDNPPENLFDDVTEALDFIRDVISGFSCLSFAKSCVVEILDLCKSDTVVLMDGDKTLTMEDSSHAVFGYKTSIFDGNFYTGYQSWKQSREFANYQFDDLERLPVGINKHVLDCVTPDTYVLTSGHERIWSFISKQLRIPFFCGKQMASETKLYVTMLLQEAGKHVVAYGDGMNDYYMLKQANEGYLVRKADGTISRSLIGKDMEGLIIV